jgi:hypothetical protein
MSQSALETFKDHINNTDLTRSRMEKLWDDKKIFLRDIESVYESLFLRLLTAFENFCEVTFFDILEGRIAYSKNVAMPRIAACPALREIVLQGQGRKYLEWIPHDKAEKTARLYLSDGRPFTKLELDEKETIQKMVVIRNAFAHSSVHAITAFRKSLVKPLQLPPKHKPKSPASFFRGKTGAPPMTTRLEAYLSDLGKIAARIYGNPK